MVNKVVMINLSVVLVSLLLLVGVYAAGTSTGSSSGGSNSQNSASKETLNPESNSVDCEAPILLKDRIKCRIDNKIEEKNGVEEACRGLLEANKTACTSLYSSSDRCYVMQGKEKDRCFKDVIGFTVGKPLSEQPKDKVRNYMVVLLYELQKRVEDAQVKGKITSDSASKIIEKIVIAKKAILQGKTKGEVRELLTALKSQWGSIMPR